MYLQPSPALFPLESPIVMQALSLDCECDCLCSHVGVFVVACLFGECGEKTFDLTCAGVCQTADLHADIASWHGFAGECRAV
jgi:hypothetical protein